MHAIFVVVALAILAGVGHSQDMPRPGVCGVSTIKPKPTASVTDGRIINGEAVIPNSRPYQLLLVGFASDGTAKYYCGASLIKTTHVLTAAHCVAGNEAKDIRLYTGLHNFTLSAVSLSNGVPVKQYFIHESYNNRTLANDVAVIRLQAPVVVDNVKVGLICLADQSSAVCQPGNPVVASGWGSTSGSPNRTSASRPTELQQVGLQCVDKSNEECKKLSFVTILGIPLSEEKSKMCAYAQNKGVCFGDSGGPLVRERTLADGTKYLEQVGIMSGTIDCSFTKPRPDVYANVRVVHPWILNKIAASS